MMDKGPLAELLLERYEEMPPQLKIAARFVLDHPEEVALSSMREQAAQAGVSHSTMMRLARWLGMEGYEDMRSSYARALRQQPAPRTARLEAQFDGEEGVAAAGLLADSLAAQVSRLGEFAGAERLVAAARIIAGASVILALGARHEAAAAQQFAALCGLAFGADKPSRAVQDDDGLAALLEAGRGAVFVVFGQAPYDRVTVERATQAAADGAAVIAVTDSAVSPLARLARETILVTNPSTVAYRSALPSLAAAELLASLVAAEAKLEFEPRVRQQDARLGAYGVLWKPSR